MILPTESSNPGSGNQRQRQFIDKTKMSGEIKLKSYIKISFSCTNAKLISRFKAGEEGSREGGTGNKKSSGQDNQPSYYERRGVCVLKTKPKLRVVSRRAIIFITEVASAFHFPCYVGKIKTSLTVGDVATFCLKCLLQLLNAFWWKNH